MNNDELWGLLAIFGIGATSGILVHFIINKLLGNYDD